MSELNYVLCIFFDLNILLIYVYFDNATRPTEAPSVPARGGSLDTAPTPDRPKLELSTQVKVLGSEEVLPEEGPSQMSPMIESMKTYQRLWRDASDKAKHYKVVVSQLEEEVKTLWDANEGM